MAPWSPARTRAAAALFGLLVVGGPFLFGDGVDVPDDALYYALPSWQWLRTALEQGVSPFWIPGKLGGVSLFGDVVPMGPFYPSALLPLVLPALPALILAVWIHAIGTFFAVRWAAGVHGAGPDGATLAAAGVCLGPVGAAAFIDCQADAWPAFLWFPVILGSLERLARAAPEHRARWIAAGGAATALLLLGTHLRVAAAAGGALLLWGLVRGKDLRGAAAVGLLGLLGGAPGYVPILLEVSAASGGAALAPHLDLPVDQALGLHNLGGWLTPLAVVTERDLSLGAVAGVALLAALIHRERPSDGPEEQTRLRLALWGLLLLGAGASAVPGLRWFFLPLRVFSTPVDVVYAALAMIPLGILAGRGLEAMAGWDTRRARALVRGPAGAALLLLVGASILRPLTSPTLGGTESWAGTWATVQGGVVAGAALLIWTRTEPGERRRGLLLLLALLDLLSFGLRAHLLVPSRPLRAAEAPPATAALLAGGSLDLLDLARGFDSAIEPMAEARALLEGRSAEPDPGRAAEADVVALREDAQAIQDDLLGRSMPPHLAVARGTRGLAGRSKLPPARQIALLAPLADQLQGVEGDRAVLEALFERGGLGDRALRLHGVPLALWGASLGFRVPDAPACSLPDRLEAAPDEARRIERLLREPLQDDLGLVERPELVDALGLGVAAKVVCPGPEAVRVDADGPVFVTLAARAHPGREIVDDAGRVVPSIPVNQVQLGFTAPGSGTYRVRFRAPGLRESLSAAALGWLGILGMAVLGARPRRLVPAAALLLLLAGPARAAEVELRGTVEAFDGEASYEALLLETLDLARPPLARAPVEAHPVSPRSGRFSLRWDPDALGASELYLVLRQEIRVPGAGPLVFHLPLDRRPFPAARPPPSVRLRSVGRIAATSRARGEAVPGWWAGPVLLGLVVYGGGLLVLMLLGRPPDRPGRRRAPRAGEEPAPPSPGELRGALALCALAAAARVPGLFRGPLELLEHTYGPGSRRIRPVDPEATQALAERVAEALLQPSSLEVTHPPLWHLLLDGLARLHDGEWLLRLPALLASVATAWFLWRLLRRISPAAGLLAAGLFAGAAPAVHFGADATPYAFVALCAVASVEWMLRALEDGGRAAWRRWIALLVVAVLTHYGAVMFAALEVATLLALAVRRRRKPSWAVAGARAVRAGMLFAPLPLLWSVLHYRSFAAVALDTRLFADVYPLDPGRAAFVGEFLRAGAGVGPSWWPAAVVLYGLAVLGLGRVLRRDAHLGLVLLALVVGFVGGTVFFHGNLVRHLDGRVFWGFRWVAWFVPIGLGLAALGFTDAVRAGPLPRRLVVGGLGAAWAVGALLYTLQLPETSTRPAYDAAAARILAELEDRDGLAVLPLWGQRGPLTWYLTKDSGARFRDEDGSSYWDFGGRRAFLEALDEGLPFETSAINGHVDRLWVLVPDERVFGRPKFAGEVAAAALRWADAQLVPDGRWTLVGLELRRYRRPPREGFSGGPLRITAPSSEPGSVRWLEPNAPACADPEEEGGERRWRLRVRVPIAGSGRAPDAAAIGGELRGARVEAGAFEARVEGGPCSAPPPVLTLR